jgi:hypothetical protein
VYVNEIDLVVAAETSKTTPLGQGVQIVEGGERKFRYLFEVELLKLSPKRAGGI